MVLRQQPDDSDGIPTLPQVQKFFDSSMDDGLYSILNNGNFTNFTEANCREALLSTTDIGYNIVRALQIILALIFIVLFNNLCFFYKKNPINLHGNMMIILVSILSLYVFFMLSCIVLNLRNFILLLSYSSSCDCLTPVWLVYLLRMPFYIYIFASPMLHFLMMLERVRATKFVQNYEKEGHTFGIGCVTVTFFLTSLFCLYIYLSSIIDTPTYSNPMAYIALTSKYNSMPLYYSQYFVLFLVICISIADYVLICQNRKIKNDISVDNTYNLSRNYQAKENVLTMRIIFPLDFSYTFFFTIFMILSVYLRSNRDQIGPLAYKKNLEAFTLLLFIHAIITLVTYKYFLRRRIALNRQMLKEINAQERTNTYFKTLQNQWMTN